MALEAADDYIDLSQDGLLKILQGVTTVEEVMRISQI